jgi:FixJ family two-component response regulator
MTRSWRTERWRTGAFDYLVKPFNLMRLIEVVKAALASRH